MSNAASEFEEELELFRKEVQGATQFFYGFLAVNTAAANRRAVLNLMNEAPDVLEYSHGRSATCCVHCSESRV